MFLICLICLYVFLSDVVLYDMIFDIMFPLRT